MSREGRALRKERRDRQRILTRLMKGADPEVSGWVPDPTGGHDLRFIRNGVRTELVSNGDDLATDSSISRAGGFDWYGPDTDTAPRAAAMYPDWLMPGTYMYRCRSKGTWSGAKPTWYSPVWAAGRKIYLVDASSRTATHIAGEAFSWEGFVGRVFRDGSAVGSITGIRSGSLCDLNGHPLARKKSTSVQSLDGAPIASGYCEPNPSVRNEYDDTVVFTVTAELTGRLATLVLAWGLRLPGYAHYNPPAGGG
jgi:hypothetical protein